MSGRQHCIGKEAAAPTVADVPVLREEHEISQQELESQGGNYPFSVEEEDEDDSNDTTPVVLQARLTKCPRSLHDISKEYSFGFAGCNPAKDWTGAERGKDCFKCYNRNVFCVQVSQMIRAGHTTERAGDLVYRAYGANLSVTKVIKKMIADKTGGHPALGTAAV